jgi:predicted DNA-binding transcriptional regulator AlpA
MTTIAIEHDRLLDADEAAKMLGTTTGTLSVWRCTQRYDLPWVKIGRRVRYRLSAIQRFVESRTVQIVAPE